MLLIIAMALFVIALVLRVAALRNLTSAGRAVRTSPRFVLLPDVGNPEWYTPQGRRYQQAAMALFGLAVLALVFWFAIGI